MFFIRQGATHKVVLGPAVAVGDGFTPVTNLALSSADEAEAILHDNGTVVDISGYTWAAITTADGYYHLTLQAGISGTVGHLTIVVNDDSLILPLKAEFTVLEEAVYDAMYASSAAGPLQSTTAGRTLDVTAGGAAGIDWANVENPTTAVDLSGTDIQLCDTVTANTDMRGTDSAALASVATEARLAELDAGNLAGDVAAVKTDTAAILTDTSDMQPKLGSPAGADMSADIAAVKAETATIVADTNELQADWADAGRLDAILDARASQATANAIETDTQDIQSRIPAALSSGNIKADVLAISTSTTAADRLEASTLTIVPGTVDNAVAPTTTVFEADDITEATADHYIGRVIIFTSGALQYQATDITDYALNGANGQFTVTALTEAPANDDTFIII